MVDWLSQSGGMLHAPYPHIQTMSRGQDSFEQYYRTIIPPIIRAPPQLTAGYYNTEKHLQVSPALSVIAIALDVA